ncbi:uncharacterized protein BDZ83DRAFT_374585 [Colletotrichum acutatum]|uniref:Uncharacterized protein n=1 Tax=Glomerella acutata TaxID=27357 RepID=A0AAD9D2A0_GLOAC|nr:uncharacterized protein BDZ83DRAFT_374585 [Colletotrichum acutatum]KAK1730555.1 hypothetical protein BDZ83DRAFT_374585 [Colletotrichum acutatum]
MSPSDASRPSASPRLSSLPWVHIHGPRGIQPKRKKGTEKVKSNPQKHTSSWYFVFWVSTLIHNPLPTYFAMPCVIVKFVDKGRSPDLSLQFPPRFVAWLLALRHRFLCQAHTITPSTRNICIWIYHWWFFCRFEFIICLWSFGYSWGFRSLVRRFVLS